MLSECNTLGSTRQNEFPAEDDCALLIMHSSSSIDGCRETHQAGPEHVVLTLLPAWLENREKKIRTSWFSVGTVVGNVTHEGRAEQEIRRPGISLAFHLPSLLPYSIITEAKVF